MSLVKVRAALEVALNAMSPALSTHWENVPFVPVNGTPYQQVFLDSLSPENPTMGDSFYRERGILQINLRYPVQTGSNAATTRAELIRTTFYRGASFQSGGVTVLVEKTPEIGSGTVAEGWWFVPVRVRFFANIL